MGRVVIFSLLPFAQCEEIVRKCPPIKALVSGQGSERAAIATPERSGARPALCEISS